MIYIFVEDELSQAIVNKLLDYLERTENLEFPDRAFYNKNGCGNIKREMRKYNKIARTYPVIVLVDLNATECAPLKKEEFIDFNKNEKLIFRIAIREVEAWLFADRKNFASFLGVRIDRMPKKPEEIADPKKLLFDISRKSQKRVIKEDIPPEPGSLASIGKNYNGRLKEFVLQYWDINIARNVLKNKSLDKALNAFSSIRLP
ncbi:hypothetical protein DRQ36_02935 [bacterium]|nr:MAG: hypothetical protein DRQ36_02935 [bacterium]